MVKILTNSGDVSLVNLAIVMKPLIRDQANAVFAELMGEVPNCRDLPAYQSSKGHGLPRIR